MKIQYYDHDFVLLIIKLVLPFGLLVRGGWRPSGDLGLRPKPRKTVLNPTSTQNPKFRGREGNEGMRVLYNPLEGQVSSLGFRALKISWLESWGQARTPKIPGMIFPEALNLTTDTVVSNLPAIVQLNTASTQ